MANRNGLPTVCVTGASGFVGCHVAKCFLEKGYRVRGTVRDASNQAKTQWLKDMAKGLPGTLELVSADLMVPESFDSAVSGCEIVCHVAAVSKLKAKDPKKEIVDPIIQGTRNVFDAILKARVARRVVMTSSIMTVVPPEVPRNCSKVFSEADWAEEATAEDEAYAYAKTQAEKAAWEYYHNQPHESNGAGAWRFELVTVLPSVVLGPIMHPQHMGTSPQVIQQLLDGSFPLAPDLYFPIVDVRDVAHLHWLAATDGRASGRYVAMREELSVIEIAALLRPHFPRAYIPSRRMAHFLMYLVALFHPQLTFKYLRQNLGVRKPLTSAKAQQELGFNFRSVEESAVDTALSLYEHKILRERA